jgi:hypothetical protein
MVNQNDNIVVQVQLGAPPITRAGFGIALVADTGGSMSERIRFYASASAAAADATLGEITAAQSAHIAAAFAQKRKPALVAAGRVSLTPVAQVVTFTIGGGVDGDYTITINGTDYTHTASTQTDAQIATALAALVNADAAVGAAAVGAVITVTASAAGTPFAFSSASTGSAITALQTVANVSLLTELNAVLAESSDWYGLHLVSRVAANILLAAQWAEANGRLHIAQSSDAAILGSGGSDIASQLVSAGYARTHLRYYGTNATPMAFALLANRLAFDLDTQAAPTWGPVPLVGITADATLTNDTQILNARNKRAGLYLPLKGVLATDANANGQRVAAGNFLDERVIADWLKARCEEALATRLLELASRGRKVPYTDLGFSQLANIVSDQLERGVTLGNFERAIGSDGEVISPLVIVPRRADVPAGDVSARKLNLRAQALFAGAVTSVELVVDLTSDLGLLELLAAQ